jgi:conjugal transfer pilus assembly protein TraW
MNFMFIFLFLILQQQTFAKSLGVVGEVFPMVEKSFLHLIEERLNVLSQQGELEKLNEEWIKTVAAHANRPEFLNLKRIDQARLHYYLPQVVLSQDIADAQGKILYIKGTSINALEQLPTYNPCWLFFNADDKAQLQWAQKQMQKCTNPKLILTGGAINRAEEILNSVIYFDQAGRITQKLKIQAVPAYVTRKDNQLHIEEHAIKENGDVL